MHEDTALDRTTWVLTAIGALNWGMVGLAHFDLVAAIFGRDTFLSRTVYSLIGLAGAWSVYHLVNALTRPGLGREADRPLTEIT